MVRDPELIRAAEAARLIVKIASGEEVTARVNRIYDNPEAIIERATALLRSVPEWFGTHRFVRGLFSFMNSELFCQNVLARPPADARERGPRFRP